PVHHIASLDDDAVARLIGKDVGPRGHGENAVRKGPAGKRRIPDRGEVEEIAAVEHHPVAMVARAHPKFARGDEAAAWGESARFAAQKTIVDAVRKAGVGTPDR